MWTERKQRAIGVWLKANFDTLVKVRRPPHPKPHFYEGAFKNYLLLFSAANRLAPAFVYGRHALLYRVEISASHHRAEALSPWGEKCLLFCRSSGERIRRRESFVKPQCAELSEQTSLERAFVKKSAASRNCGEAKVSFSPRQRILWLLSVSLQKVSRPPHPQMRNPS